MRRIKLLTVLVIMLLTGLGTIVLLLRIVPLNADARFPLAVTATAMAFAGCVAGGIFSLLAHRNA